MSFRRHARGPVRLFTLSMGLFCSLGYGQPAHPPGQPIRTEPSEAEPSEAEPSEAEPSEADSSEARAEAKPSGERGLEAEPSETAESKPSRPECDPRLASCLPCDVETSGACCDPEKDDRCVDPRPKFVGVPVPTYNPQLEFSFGLLGMVTYRPIADDKISPPWSSTAFGMLTTNGSWLLAAAQQIYWDEDNNRAGLIFASGKFNTQFYGTGGGNDLGLSLPLGSAGIIVQPNYLRRVWDRLYLGARYRLLWNEAVLSWPEDSEIPPPEIVPIQSELVHSGLGLLAEYDSRDNRFSPTEGFYVPLGSIFYAQAFGGDANFASMDLAVNYYHSWLGKRLILASRAYANLATDDTPAHLKPAVGMGADLRGYATGRYRDNVLLAAQTELRWYFWWKLGAVVWGGIGTTTSGLDQLGAGTVLPSYGLGLRFLAFEEERLVIRLDYGRGDESGQLYFGVSEAF